jgi:hypothetical protein
LWKSLEEDKRNRKVMNLGIMCQLNFRKEKQTLEDRLPYRERKGSDKEITQPREFTEMSECPLICRCRVSMFYFKVLVLGLSPELCSF